MLSELDFARDTFARCGIPVTTAGDDPISAVLSLCLSVENDRDTGLVVMSAHTLASSSGVSLPFYGDVFHETIRLSVGLRDYQARALANALNVPPTAWHDFITIAHKTYQCHLNTDSLITILDPLMLTVDNHWLAAGGSLRIDANAFFRQPNAARIVQRLHNPPPDGIAFVALHGNIACIVNGAGLGMVTTDSLHRHSGGASAIVDLGSGSFMDKLIPALNYALTVPHTRVLMLNLFSGFTWCVDIARALTDWMHAQVHAVPLIVRFNGFDADEGRVILEDAMLPNLYTAQSIDEAAKRAAHLALSLKDMR